MIDKYVNFNLKSILFMQELFLLPKELEDCVQTLLDDPDFKPKDGEDKKAAEKKPSEEKK